jgi:hypothetical protein
VHHLVDGNGRPLVTLVGPGQAGDAPMFPHLRDRGITPVIPEPADQAGHRKRRGSRGGRPPAFDAVDYRSAVVLHAVVSWTKAVSDTH